MTKIISYELPTSSSSETSNGKGKPSPAPHLADGDGGIVFRHLTVSVIMFPSFCISAGNVWTDAGNHWCNMITAIVFLYSTVMIHLLLMRLLTAVATVIMLISLGVALFVSRPAWSDLASIALMLLASMGLTFLSLKLEEYERKKKLKEKHENASDLV
ncbi:hypothetical protein VPH35_126362 [Triticum aestivum]